MGKSSGAVHGPQPAACLLSRPLVCTWLFFNCNAAELTARRHGALGLEQAPFDPTWWERSHLSTVPNTSCRLRSCRCFSSDLPCPHFISLSLLFLIQAPSLSHDKRETRGGRPPRCPHACCCSFSGASSSRCQPRGVTLSPPKRREKEGQGGIARRAQGHTDQERASGLSAPRLRCPTSPARHPPHAFTLSSVVSPPAFPQGDGARSSCPV